MTDRRATRRGVRRAAALGAAAWLSLAAAPATPAQSWRTLTAQRALGRDDSLRVIVRYGLGKLTLHAAAPATLYELDLKYDADLFRPEKRYDPLTHTLTVGADSVTADRFSLRPHFLAMSGHRETKDGTMTLGLARGIPLDLTVKIGLGAADIDLGDLWLDHLRVEAALGEATVRFSTPNSRPMRDLSIDAALGGVELVKLGNARAQHVFLTAALGGADVDLRGAWTGEMTLEAKVSLGGLGLSVPRDAGVMIRAATTLGGVDTKGFIRRADGAYYSLNYATAARKVTVDAKAVLGGVGFTWVEP